MSSASQDAESLKHSLSQVEEQLRSTREELMAVESDRHRLASAAKAFELRESDMAYKYQQQLVAMESQLAASQEAISIRDLQIQQLQSKQAVFDKEFQSIRGRFDQLAGEVQTAKQQALK